MHHLDSWIKINQLMSLALFFAAQHVSNVLAFETCWAAKNKASDISWSIFIQLSSIIIIIRLFYIFTSVHNSSAPNTNITLQTNHDFCDGLLVTTNNKYKDPTQQAWNLFTKFKTMIRIMEHSSFYQTISTVLTSHCAEHGNTGFRTSASLKCCIMLSRELWPTINVS
jgi:hypothetical protein